MTDETKLRKYYFRSPKKEIDPSPLFKYIRYLLAAHCISGTKCYNNIPLTAECLL